MGRIKNIVNEHTDDFFADWAKTIYKREIDSGDLYLKDTDLEYVAIGGYLNDHNGSTDGIEEGYKPYYDYLKKDLEERKKREKKKSKREEEEEYIKSLLDYRKEQDEKERRRREEERQKEYGHMYCNPIGISVGNSISNMVNTITNTITTNMSNIISNSMNNLYNYNNTYYPQYEYIQPQYNYSYDYNNTYYPQYDYNIYYTPYSAVNQ